MYIKYVRTHAWPLLYIYIIYIYIYIYIPIMILARPFKKRLYQCDRPNVKHMSEFSRI